MIEQRMEEKDMHRIEHEKRENDNSVTELSINSFKKSLHNSYQSDLL